MMKPETTTDVLPAPPSLINALTAGFDAVSSHIHLVLAPLALDLLVLFGPHLKLSKLAEALYGNYQELIKLQGGAETAELIQLNDEMLTFASERLNLLSALRSYPVGIPSLMAPRFPVEAPGFQPVTLEVSSFSVFLILLGMLTLLGLLLGAFYFISVSQTALNKHLDLRTVIASWPRASVQVVLLALFILAVLIGISIPAFCILTGLTLGGGSLARLGLLLYFGALIWTAFPLIFSSHGIFTFGDNALTSVRRSVYITRLTLPSTSLLFLSAVVLSQGLDLIWSSAGEGSWFTLVGIAGHAFVATALLAGSFIYFRDADQYARLLSAQMKIKTARKQF